ncbi:hypothetical protein D9M70_619240 [compost metagenome]
MLCFVDHQNDDFLRLVGEGDKCSGQVDIFPEPDFVQAEIQASDSYLPHNGRHGQPCDDSFVAPNRFADCFFDDQAGVFRQVFPQIGIQHKRAGRFQSWPQVFAGKRGFAGASWCCQEDT